MVDRPKPAIRAARFHPPLVINLRIESEPRRSPGRLIESKRESVAGRRAGGRKHPWDV